MEKGERVKRKMGHSHRDRRLVRKNSEGRGERGGALGVEPWMGSVSLSLDSLLSEFVESNFKG